MNKYCRLQNHLSSRISVYQLVRYSKCFKTNMKKFRKNHSGGQITDSNKESASKSRRAQLGLRNILSRDRTVTSPVDNRDATSGFLSPSLSEPNLSSWADNEGARKTPDAINPDSDLEDRQYPINMCILNMRHVKSDGFSSTEYMDTSTEQAGETLPLSQEGLGSLSQLSSNASTSLSQCSLEKYDIEGSDSVDLGLQFFCRKSNEEACGPPANHTLRLPELDRSTAQQRSLSSPVDMSKPSTAAAATRSKLAKKSSLEQTNNAPSFRSRPKLLRTISKSHSELCSSAPRKNSRGLTESFRNIHKSFASALQLFKPRNSVDKGNKRKRFRRKQSSESSDLPPISEPVPSPCAASTPTLQEYCDEKDLCLHSTEDTEFIVASKHTASSQLLRPCFERLESELDPEELKELAAADLQAHFSEHLHWEKRTLRSTSIWSVSGVNVPPLDPTQLQFDYEVERTMTIALSTVLNLREVPNDDTNKQLADYVLKVFNSDEDTLKKLWRKATTQEKPEEKLVILVKSGSGLIAKDANGKSDPYVRVGIIDATYQDEAIQKNKNLRDWQKDRRIMPTGELKESQVKAATLEPQWDEQIELSMGRAEREMLVLECWDSDKHMAVPTKIKGFKHFFTDMRKTDDFMGRVFLSLWTIGGPIEGKVMELCSHSGKSKYGTITLDLAVEQVKKNISLELGMWEHLQLTHAIVNHEGRVGGQYRRKWRGELSEEAEKLLDKHAEFSGLSEAHKAAIRLSILVKYHRMFAVKMSTFSGLIKKIVSLESEIHALQAKSTAVDAQISWVSVLMKDLCELALDTEEILKNHLTVYNIKDPKDIEKIRHRVDMLLDLYAFPPFVDQLPSEKRDLRALLEKSVQVAVPNWFIVLCGKLMPDHNTPDMQLSAFKGLISHLLNHCNRVLQKLNPVYEKAGVDYFTQFFLTVDKLILVEAVSKLEIRENPDDVTTYEVYKTMKEIRKLKSRIDRKRHRELKLIHFHKWFNLKVNHWITLATERCRERIKQAIQLDKIVQVSDDVQFSSSAVDGTGFLFLLMKLDEELEWPAKAEALTIRVTIVKSVCDCALYYVLEVYRSLKKEDMFDEQGRFRATEKLSIVLNNMQHIKQVLVKHLKEYSQRQQDSQDEPVEEFESPLAEGGNREQENTAEQEKRIQTHSAELMEALIQSAGEDIDTKIADIICQITKKMSPEVNRLLADVLDSKSPTVSLETIDPLMTYMTNNLQTLGEHLLTPVFQLILRDMWCLSTDCLLGFLNQGGAKRSSDPTLFGLRNHSGTKRNSDPGLFGFREQGGAKKSSDPALYYNKLKFILQTLRDFFYADGNGLTGSDLENSSFKNLRYHLEILSLQTDKLIYKFFLDLVDMQIASSNSGEAKFGEVMLSIGYHEDREVIEVNLFQASNLPGLDSSGLSDPFIEFSLMPPWAFGLSKPHKIQTSKKKKTVNPVFNEEFMIPAAKEPLQNPGTVLLLTVFDHDLFGPNDLCGICVVPCLDIPFLSPVSSAFDNPNATERKNLTLPLFQISESTIALKELYMRANSQVSDAKASDFLKINKQILANVDLKNTAHS